MVLWCRLRIPNVTCISGELPGAFCRERTEGWFIPGISPIKTCEVHREVLVDVASGLRVPIDDGTRELKREVFEFWPSDFLTLFDYAKSDASAFDEMLAELRATEEWKFVEREVDIRLVKA